MIEPTSREPWEQIEDALASGDAGALLTLVERLPPGEPARAVSRLEPESQRRLLTRLAPEDAAQLLGELPLVQAAEVLRQLEPAAAAAIANALSSDVQTDLLGSLEPDEAAAILRCMAPEEAADVRELSRYAPDTAGGLMVTEYLVYPEDARVSDVLEDLRTHAERYADYHVQYAYVTRPDGGLAGVLRLRDLLLSRPDTPIAALMLKEPLHVPVDAPLAELNQFFHRHAFFGVPVIDAGGELAGVVRRDDVEEALGHRAEGTLLKVSGIVGGEELRTMPLHQRSLRRLSWLSLNIVLNVVAASVIAAYQDTLAAVISLAVFLPIISDMSGCSGNQAVAVSLRELTLGLVRPYEVLRVVLKEAGVGLINGAVLGLLLGAVAYAWRGNLALSLVVGTALALNTLLSVVLGGSVPLVLRRLGVDPALASGPVLTTVTDMCGFLLVLSLATAMLARIAG